MDEKILAHHGIKGQHWGVRRTPEQLGRTKSTVDNASTIVRETKNINREVSKLRSSVSNKKLDSMSDQELRERVNRLNLEQQYSQLSSAKVSKGHSHVDSVLNVAGSTLGVASSALSIALAIKQLKK